MSSEKKNYSALLHTLKSLYTVKHSTKCLCYCNIKNYSALLHTLKSLYTVKHSTKCLCYCNIKNSLLKLTINVELPAVLLASLSRLLVHSSAQQQLPRILVQEGNILVCTAQLQVSLSFLLVNNLPPHTANEGPVRIQNKCIIFNLIHSPTK